MIIYSIHSPYLSFVTLRSPSDLTSCMTVLNDFDSRHFQNILGHKHKKAYSNEIRIYCVLNTMKHSWHRIMYGIQKMKPKSILSFLSWFVFRPNAMRQLWSNFWKYAFSAEVRSRGYLKKMQLIKMINGDNDHTFRIRWSWNM